MSEYFVIANLDKLQMFRPCTFDEGLELREFAPGRGKSAMVLTLLLADRWRGDRVAVVGDDNCDLYALVTEFRNIGAELREMFSEDIAEEAEYERMVSERMKMLHAENARLNTELAALQKAVRDAMAGSNVKA
jgi:hypothetical protein